MARTPKFRNTGRDANAEAGAILTILPKMSEFFDSHSPRTKSLSSKSRRTTNYRDG